MEPYSLDQQKKRLALVSKQQWREALATLTRHMTKKLGAVHIEDEWTGGVLKGGKTRTGAHSELNLGGNALQHYQGGAVKALYHGEAEWPEGTPLADALIEAVNELMKEEVSAYKKRHNLIGLRAEDDVETMPEAQQPAEEEDTRVEQLQMMWDAVKGEPDLERYVDALGRHRKLEGLSKELGISKRDADNLRKRVKRRTEKIKEQ